VDEAREAAARREQDLHEDLTAADGGAPATPPTETTPPAAA
jgi:hypothetical protein